MAADDDGFGPARHEARHILADDGFAEDDATQNVADGAVGRLPHLFQLELRHAGFIRRDGGALDAHTVQLDGIGGIDSDFVFGGVPVFNGEIVVV